MQPIAEDQVIYRIRRRIPSATGGLLRLGIGDDAAVLRPRPGTELVVTCDQFIEGVHYLRDVHPPDAVGYKALARATSDLAAMGARPQVFFLTISLRSESAGRWLDAMLGGMARAARAFGLRLAGGDTGRAPSNGGAALSLTVIGEAKSGSAVLRRGAHPGDSIFVTGQLGAAQLGLELVLRGMQRQARWARLLRPHYYPLIQLDLGQWLAGRGYATAMMDLSDGLSTDLNRLCRESNIGAHIYEKRLPLLTFPKGLPAWFDPLELALHGGEDYALLFTAPRKVAAKLPRARKGTRLTQIGEVVTGTGVSLEAPDGTSSLLEPGGWDHFSRK